MNQGDGYHWNRQVGCRTQHVTGQDPQTTAVRRDFGIDSDIHGKIGDGPDGGQCVRHNRLSYLTKLRTEGCSVCARMRPATEVLQRIEVSVCISQRLTASN